VRDRLARADPGETQTGDELTIIAAAQCDPRAFAPLYERYVTPVYRYLRSRLPTDEEAADVTQEVFVRALDALPRYRQGTAPFSAWLFRIARNMATDSHRRRRSTVTWEFLPEALHPTHPRATEETILEHETLDQLRSLLLQLSPEKQEILALRFVVGLTAREIASIIGKSEAAIHKQLRRTLHALKEQYRAE
jgi:RNA polymerase sigma-70 factor, ECF subfamily